MNLAEIKELSVYRLAEDFAECAIPDNSTSAGALMLSAVRDNIVERIESTPGITAEDLRDAVGDFLDGVVDYRTFQKWEQFRDLAAWQEENESESDGEWSGTIDAISDRALYQIADRCAYALIGAWEPDETDSDGE